jgi:hypothetical protein
MWMAHRGGGGGGRGDGEGWGPTPSVRYSNNTAARSLQDSAASSAKKIRLLEKKLGCNSAKLSLKGNWLGLLFPFLETILHRYLSLNLAITGIHQK